MLEMRQRAYEMDKEHWLVPPEVARFFQILARLTGAKRIYEFGSFLGYSGIAWAEVLPSGGEVFLTEIDPKNYDLMTDYVSRSPDQRKITCRYVDAQVDLKSEGLFDIILIDHDKTRYPEAWPLAKQHLSEGGLIIIDDVLWRGRVCREAYADDPSTKGVRDLNELVRDDPDMLSLIIPIGDGVCLAMRR
jgi:predicted O-methyltransferase YrrM